MTSHLPRQPRLALLVAALFGLGLALFGSAGTAGAAPDEVIDLPFEPYEIDHHEPTDQFLIAHYVEAGVCSTQLTMIERNGDVTWSVPQPGACRWLLDDGDLFVASGNSIRRYDVATGELVREWILADNVRVDRMFRGGPLLYFNHQVISVTGRASPAVGSLAPDVQDSVGTSFDDLTLMGTAGNGRFLYLRDRAGLVTRFDQDGQTDLIEMATATINSGWEFAFSADEQLLYVGGNRPHLFDAETLEQLSDPAEQRRHVASFDALSDGRVLGIGGDSNAGVAELWVRNTLDPVANGPYIAGPNSGSNYSDAVVVTDPIHGDRLAVAAGSRIEIHPIAPTLSSYRVLPGPSGDDLEAGYPATLRLTIDWVDAVETVTFNGDTLPFQPILDQRTGDALALEVELPALPAGAHVIEFDGPLGRTSSQIVVEPAERRSELQILVRSDSAPGEVNAGVSCVGPDRPYFDPYDLYLSEVVPVGDRLTVYPIVGDTCTISYERAYDPAVFDGSRHLTGGFFDPTTDPGAWGMVDIHTQTVDVQVGTKPVGFGVFLPEFDDFVLWTYAYGFGQAPEGERTVSIDCEGTEFDSTHRIFYGYWYRSVLPAQGCQVHHPAPDGSLFSGWGEIVVEIGELSRVTNDNPGRHVWAYEPLMTLYTLDVYPHPSEHNGAFVRQQYLDFLGRQGDPGGIRHWTASLDNGSRTRTDLVEQFLASPEFGGTAAPVNRLYRAYFDRAPDREGLFFWMDWIRSGRTLAAVSDEFARSPEFTRTYGALDDPAFIDLVYSNVLGRAPDASGRAFWVDQMNRGLTRGELMVNFSESIEFIELTSAEVIVESLYQGLLQRSPDPQGFEYWTGVADSGAPLSHLIAGMLSSDEYYDRFVDLVDEPPRSAAGRLTLQVAGTDPVPAPPT